MDKKTERILFFLIPSAYLLLAFFYILLVVRPAFYFHHVQPPFLLSLDFFARYLDYPGGIAGLLANFFMQSFYYNFIGPIVFLCIILVLMWLTVKLMNVICTSKLNYILALIPSTFAIFLPNDYNFPFSVIVSMLLVLALLLLLAKKGKSPVSILVFYLTGAVLIYYISGSGFMLLFSVLALFFSARFKLWTSLSLVVFISGFAVLFPRIAFEYIFAIPPGYMYFYFLPPEIYFRTYQPSAVFYIFLLVVPVLLIINVIMARFLSGKVLFKKINLLKLNTMIAYGLVMLVACLGHQASWQGDEKKIVACDYYCYHNDPGKTAGAATSLANYSFAVNVNYNLAMSKAGRLTDEFFGFFQMTGTDALYPDVDYLSEMGLISMDYYYDLGYISEARHWAYESLVYYPYSIRALQMLVKVHLITGEYGAAERCINILNKELIDKEFVHKYAPCIKDTTMVSADRELAEKRSFIPARHELSPFIDRRFRELLEANSRNKSAYEHLMLFYLLDSQLDNFMLLYKDVGNYYDKPVDIYEEAILMYGEMKHIAVESQYIISPATLARFQTFKQIISQYRGNDMLARKAAYRDMGKTYMYYLRFIYPRIVKPEIINNEDAPI